jgi:hypothetical protein
LDDKGGSGGGTRTPDTRIMIPCADVLSAPSLLPQLLE